MTTRSRSLAFLFAAGLAFGAFAVHAQGTVINFVTPVGATSGGQAVDAEATLTTSAGQITVVLKNLKVNPTSVAQNISDFSFDLAPGFSGGTLSSSSGKERTVAGDGSYSDGSVVSTGWALTAGGSSFALDVLGTAVGPAHTIIGLPDNTNAYSAANGSIAGNGPHNPFLAGDVTFTVAAGGVTVSTGIEDATFSSGTTAGNDIVGVVSTSEPATMGLLVLGGIGMMLHRRRV
jgi:hypothetical protein